MNQQNPLLTIALILGLVYLVNTQGCQMPTTAPKVTAVTFVYEKDLHPVPRAIQAALSDVNDSGIVGSVFEIDTVDGATEIPDQYKAAHDAAKEYGMPCLVAQAGDVVVKVIKNPTRESDVLEAVK